MKLVNADKIKAVLKELSQQAQKRPYKIGLFYNRGQMDAYAEIDTFLDNLPEEKQEDLEEELAKWRHKHFHGRRDNDATGEYLERKSQLALAYHFYNLGISKRDDYPKIKGYIARDENDYLCFYHNKPNKNGSEWWPFDGNKDMQIESCLFPKIKWEDKEPTEVELIIKKV